MDNDKIAEIAGEAYVMCALDATEQRNRMETMLKVTSDRCGGTVKIIVRHPTVHTRVFRCSVDLDDIYDADVRTNTIVPDEERDEFQENFMTCLINWLEGDAD